MQNSLTVVFTDGAAKGNPGPGGWGAIIVTPDGRVTELGGGAPHTTNNRMELSGAIAALQRVADRPGPIVVYTDSTYLIQGITQWIWGWRRRGWKTAEGSDVLNRDLWEGLSSLTDARARGELDWRWVRGHVGTAGNERCDEIAVAFALQSPTDLYDGPLDSYPRPVLQLPDDTSLPKRSSNSDRCEEQGASLFVSQRRGRRADAARHVGRMRGPREGPRRSPLQEGRERRRRIRHPARMGHRPESGVASVSHRILCDRPRFRKEPVHAVVAVSRAVSRFSC